MTARMSTARWEGSLKDGAGTMTLGSGMFAGPFTRASRFEDGTGTNPEELIAAAHAGCFAMFLSAILSNDGHVPNSIESSANVHITAGPTISRIDLVVRGDVPGIDEATFVAYAERAKAGCPVSKALAAVETITLDAALVG